MKSQKIFFYLPTSRGRETNSSYISKPMKLTSAALPPGDVDTRDISKTAIRAQDEILMMCIRAKTRPVEKKEHNRLKRKGCSNSPKIFWISPRPSQ